MKANPMKRRQVFSIATFLLTMSLVLFGCGGGSSGGGAPPSNPSGNNAPAASDSAITVGLGSTYNGTLSASDADADPLTYTIVAAPSMGTATITDASTGAFTYTAPNQSGNDSFTFKVSDGKVDSNTATVSVTVSTNPNQAPVAVAPAAFSADELAAVLLDGTGSSDAEDGQALTYSWTQTAGPVQVTLLDADQATASFNAPAVESGTNLLLTFKLTVTDSGSLTAEDSVDVTIDAAGHIIGSAAPAPYHVDLTQEGTLDWASFGYYTANSFISKMSGTNELSNYTQIGTVTPLQSAGNPAAFSWTDGDPDDANHNPADQTRNRVRFADATVNEGIKLTVPADVTDKILKVYLGAYSHKGKVTVRLANDPGVTPYTISLDSPHEDQDAWVVTILFGAASGGDQLEFEYTVEADTGSAAGGHINLAAATLMPAQAMTPTMSPLPGTYTDPVSVTLATTPTDVPIRYTDDGTQPTGTSTLYTTAINLTDNKTINAQASYPGLNSSAVASGAYTIDTTATGTMSATVAPAPYHTDLTQEGTLDWASWGFYTENSFISKMGGTNALSDYTQIGSVTPVQSAGSPVTFSWTDGDPDDANHNPADETRQRVIFSNTSMDDNEGIRLTIPANDVEKTLRVYLGAYSMAGQVTVSMEDGSTPTYTTTLSSPDLIQEAWVVTVDFAAAQGTNTNLILDFVRSQDPGVAGGHINIAAATLTDQ
jgi:hypothetical protein